MAGPEVVFGALHGGDGSDTGVRVGAGCGVTVMGGPPESPALGGMWGTVSILSVVGWNEGNLLKC